MDLLVFLLICFINTPCIIHLAPLKCEAHTKKFNLIIIKYIFHKNNIIIKKIFLDIPNNNTVCS